MMLRSGVAGSQCIHISNLLDATKLSCQVFEPIYIFGNRVGKFLFMHSLANSGIIKLLYTGLIWWVWTDLSLTGMCHNRFIHSLAKGEWFRVLANTNKATIHI